ncbi:MAG: hypothetical protein LBF38_05575 [Deltaproteobacteria bacterium]|jgi:hypothetical protein|nr:hypothetical protein [Deltaproteobacteria bacterium]
MFKFFIFYLTLALLFFPKAANSGIKINTSLGWGFIVFQIVFVLAIGIIFSLIITFIQRKIIKSRLNKKTSIESFSEFIFNDKIPKMYKQNPDLVYKRYLELIANCSSTNAYPNRYTLNRLQKAMEFFKPNK